MPERTVLLAGLPVKVGDAETHRAFWDLVDTGNWEPATLEAISRLTNGGVYIDIGAWIGPTVIAAARKASLVVAYEPDPVAVAELHRNIHLNGLTNVEVREVALLDRDAALPMGPGMLDELGLSVSSLVYGSRTVLVPVRDARKEATSDCFMRCLLLKIDVEGGEYKLIRRLSPYLQRHEPTLLLSLHGVHWRSRTFEHVPHSVAAIYRRFRSAAERLLLLWRLKHYPYVYVEASPSWRAISKAERWALLFNLAEEELLLSHRPYPVE